MCQLALPLPLNTFVMVIIMGVPLVRGSTLDVIIRRQIMTSKVDLRAGRVKYISIRSHLLLHGTFVCIDQLGA